MHISFHGAAREVTGSCHLVDTGEARILLDCGLIQGGRERHERNREPFPFDVHSLTAVVLSHAHIDHSGRLPLLRKVGYRGPIITTAPTARLLEIMLADSGRIHEEDARWKIKRLKKKGEDASWVTPLYTEEDALGVLDQITTVDFDQRRLVFSGDLGVHGARLLGHPHPVTCPDFLIMESTYGDRDREETEDRTEQLFHIIDRTTSRGGKVIIPAFAVGRTQEVLTRINDLVDGGRLSGVPVYVDSPMAVAATKAFALHPKAFSKPARETLDDGDSPLHFDGLELVTSVEQSMALNHSHEPSVIISASGMCTAGRVKHHLKHNISHPRTTVLFVGYQAAHTLGRVIQSGVSPVRIFGDSYPVKAAIETIDGFSAHADLEELLGWFESLQGPPRHTFIVHGEEETAVSFGKTLGKRFNAKVTVPTLGERVELD